ncbi:MAG: DUF1847 domain-containing protein [Thermodesulfobacteriota bacterium]|nr:DUF1847 domain-containing protein [Thermodesulfobacteriota bacterium]
MEIKAHCARCKIPRSKRVCLIKEGGKGPAFCPTLNYQDLILQVTQAYQAPDLKNFARLASVQEAECYADRKPGNYVIQPTKCRVQETVEFAQKLGFKKLGIAFCGGVQKEAGLLSDILESQGFELASVGCNAGGVPKENIGITEKEKVRIGSYETMCNPLLQAEILNHEETELNIVLGLCVGHDALFLKKAKAFCTVLAAKDRVTGHNPMAALYTMHSYYQKLKNTD